MKQTIRQVLDDMKDSQINLGSETARETISSLVSAALKNKGCYTEYDDSEIEEQNARATWVCSICGENTFDVEYDYLGSGTNHLGCEMKSWDEIKDYVEDIDDQAHAQGRGSSHRVVDDAGVDIKTGKYVGDSGVRREKNWLQKKHENKVFGGDTGTDADFGHDQGGNYTIPAGEEVDGMYFDDEVKEWEEAVGYKEDDDIPEGLKRAKELAQEAIKEGLQKQAYMEMTSDGLPEGGDTQAVLESHKLADEIVDNQKEKWIYESPDGGKTVFRRPFADYDPKNKEEIDWETKEPTGRKFTEYNGGKWNE